MIRGPDVFGEIQLDREKVTSPGLHQTQLADEILISANAKSSFWREVLYCKHEQKFVQNLPTTLCF
ncbi:hypothetical protein SAMN02745166_00190 [Prosthecobacter debontii]|uniref:Uncharacterized protein n=1 Tax=Prosthecobacter debontii TaxID=48467 RepID=A0A1T4WHU5_9BACT|nr:hypothetical protein SAMN02745166_00190 [Prosthecobacter debontii]